MSDIFPSVRFNGCLGILQVSSDEIIFEDDSLGIKLSWGLDTLEEEVLQPVTFSVDLAFKLGGITERTSFQMTNFPEVARFRSCLADRRRVLTKQDSGAAKIAWNEPSSEFETDSLHSFKTFYDESGTFTVSSTTGETEFTTPGSPLPEEEAKAYAKYLKTIPVVSPTAPDPPEVSSPRKSDVAPMQPKRPSGSPPPKLSNGISLLGKLDDEELAELEDSIHLEEMMLPTMDARPHHRPSLRPEDSVATLVVSNKYHDSDRSNSTTASSSSNNDSINSFSFSSSKLQDSSGSIASNQSQFENEFQESNSQFQNEFEDSNGSIASSQSLPATLKKPPPPPSNASSPTKKTPPSTRKKAPPSSPQPSRIESDNDTTPRRHSSKKKRTTSKSLSPKSPPPPPLFNPRASFVESNDGTAPVDSSRSQRELQKVLLQQQQQQYPVVSSSNHRELVPLRSCLKKTPPASPVQVQRHSVSVGAINSTAMVSRALRESQKMQQYRQQQANSQPTRSPSTRNMQPPQRRATEPPQRTSSRRRSPMRDNSHQETHVGAVDTGMLSKAERVSHREGERERRREQKLRAQESRRSMSPITTADCRAARPSEINQGLHSSTSSRSNRRASSSASPRRSSRRSTSLTVRTEDALVAFNMNNAATGRHHHDALTMQQRVAIASHAAASMPPAVAGTNEFVNQYDPTARLSNTGSEKSSKSYEDCEDPTESTLPDFSGVSHHHRTSDTALVEATLVEEDSSNGNSSSGFMRRTSTVASPVDVTAEDRKVKMRLWGGLVCVCGLLLMSIILVVTFSLGASLSNDVPMVPAQNGKDMMELTTEERYEVLMEELLDVVYDQANFVDLLSPQRLALQWMSTSDSQTKTLMMEDNHDRLRQRFILAVFYYTMTQYERFPHCAPEETGETAACIHPVLESYANEGLFSDQRMSEPAFRWLSYVEECRWAGVKCEDGVNVSQLSLAGYGLRSTLPVEIGYLSTLRILDLQRNQLYGSLPGEWGLLAVESSWESIRLDRNALTGAMPAEWCNIDQPGLQDMVLSNNYLTGRLPDCLGDLTALENFSVLHNSLSGELPSSLGNLPDLKRLHLAGNRFYGTIPDSVCAANATDPLLFEATADCDNSLELEVFVECPCCTTCCVAGRGDEEECDARLVESQSRKRGGH